MKKGNVKLVIFFLMGILLSGVTAFVVAESLINSKDVVYEDNSNLAADNVQDAIDGTCSKIDTRLSDIEDKLYIIKNMRSFQLFTSSEELAYTGIPITFPANSECSITIVAQFNNNAPLDLVLSRSSTECNIGTDVAHSYDTTPSSWGNGYLKIVENFTFDNETTYYVWAKYTGVGSNGLRIHGFCATKYK